MNTPDEHDYPDIGRLTQGGWGRVVNVNDESHITITYPQADDGQGFHITSGDGRGSIRDYFDWDGNPV